MLCGCWVKICQSFFSDFLFQTTTRKESSGWLLVVLWWSGWSLPDGLPWGPNTPPPLPRPLRNKTWPLVPVWEWQPWIMHWLCLTYTIIKWRIKKLLVWNTQAMTCGSTAIWLKQPERHLQACHTATWRPKRRHFTFDSAPRDSNSNPSFRGTQCRRVNNTHRMSYK